MAGGLYGWLLVASRELKVGNLSVVPTGVLFGALEVSHFAQAGLEYEPLLFALPEEVFIFFGEGAEVHVFVGIEVDDVLRVVLHGFAVGEKTRPHGGPAGVEDLLLGYIGAEFQLIYSNTQS